MRTWTALAAWLVGVSGWACCAQARGDDAPGRVWVYFTDKGYRTIGEERAALARLEREYPRRAIERRRLRRTAPGLLDARDLAVRDGYVRAVEALGARVHVTSRWLNAVSVEGPEEALAAIRALTFVDRVEAVRGGRREGEPASGARTDAGGARDLYGLSGDQLRQINVPALHAQGFTGAGVVIGILDTGFHRVHDAFFEASNPLPVVAEWDFINNDSNAGIDPGDPPDQFVHGTLILGAIRAYLPDEMVGGAYGASVILCKTEDISGETPIEEDNYVAGLEFIELHGGDVATSSLGYIDWYTQQDLDGATAVTTIAVNVATANGVHCCTAAGNSGNDGDPGSSHLIAPSDAFEVISCGAVSIEGSITGFSSDGPTADGRVKPELLACGADTWTIWPYDTTGYVSASGTSLSTPLVAGAVACLVQARPQWSVATMRTRLFETASDYAANGQADPLFVRGYGIVDAAGALAADCLGDFNGDGTANTIDVISFLNVWASGSSAADINHDGSVNTIDVIAFLNAWAAGC